MTSRGFSPAAASMVKCLPMGFSPGQKRCARVSLMTATQGVSDLSASLKSRPCSMGVFIVLKKLSVTKKWTTVALGLPSGSRVEVGSTATFTGDAEDPATDSAPGRVFKLSYTLWICAVGGENSIEGKP